MNNSRLSMTEEYLERMRSFRCKGILCDVSLVAGNEGFPAHRVLLAAASDYFRAMFSGSMKEVREARVALKDVSPAALRSFLDFVYGMEGAVTPDTAVDMLILGDKYSIPSLKNEAATCIQKNLDTTNCVAMLLLARKTDCSPLVDNVADFVGKNIKDLCHSSQFLSLDKDDMCFLLSLDGLGVVEESDVLDAVDAWLSHSNNEKNVESVLSCVRFTQVNPRFLREYVRKCPFLSSSRQTRELLLNAYETLAVGDPCSDDNSPGSPPIKRRRKAYGGFRSDAIRIRDISDAAAVHRVIFRNFSSMKKRTYSDTFLVGNVEWCILLYPLGNNAHHLSVYLAMSERMAHDSTFSCETAFKLTVVNQLSSEENVTRSSEHVFRFNHRDFGFRNFIPLEKLHDGYVLSDVLIIEAEVRVS